MIINHNISAMNTHRQLGANNNAVSSSLEKLSSGLKINRAGDDAAGLAISEKMRGQIRGLDMAQKNAQDGISMIQTAEGALNETHSILQRMRELATQAANDTNTPGDRAEIQKEVNELTSEINRIGNTTEFNTQSLLKGSETAQELRAAVNIDGLGKTTGDAAVFPGGVTASGSTTPAAGAKLTLTAAQSVAAANNKTLEINLQGEKITLTIKHDATADNQGIVATGSGATITVAEDKAATVMGEEMRNALQQVIDANENLAGKYTVSGAGAEVVLTSTETGSDQFINAVASDAAVSDSRFANGTDETHTAATAEIQIGFPAAPGDLLGKAITINGQSVEFYDANVGVYDGEADFAVNINGVDNADKLTEAIAKQLSDKLDGVTLAVKGGSADTLVVSATADGAAGDGIVVTDGVAIDAVTSAGSFSATFQVGANKGQSMTIAVGDMRASALGLTGAEGAEGFGESANVTNGTDNSKVEAALDLSTHESASKAIETINNAIEQVSGERSKLGSYQNRLEHTINNLGTSSENLSAAEARIRDTDMAKEMMEFTKNNILTQAAQAMLAQANQTPQGVLQLLR